MKSLLLFTIAIAFLLAGWFAFRADSLGIGMAGIAAGLVILFAGLVVNHGEHTRK
jgi:hypothetical protein